MKKLLIVITIVCMLLGISGCNSTQTNNTPSQEEIVEGKYPTEWNDEAMYADEAAFKADCDKLEAYAAEFAKYEGTLDTVDGLYGYISTIFSKEFNQLYDKLYSYVSYSNTAFPLEQKYKNCANMLNNAVNTVYASQAFFNSELASIPYEKRVELFNDERLQEYQLEYAYYLMDFEDTADDFDDSTSQLFSDLTISHGKVKSIFNNFVSFELPSIEYKLENGEVITIDDSNVITLLADPNYSYEDKIKFNDLWWEHTAQFKNTLTSLIEATMLEQFSDVKINGYEDSKSAALDNMLFAEDIIQKVIDTARSVAYKQAEYYSLYADKDNKYYTFSKFLRLGKYNPEEISYDDGIDEILDALSVMGDEYLDNVKEIVNSGHIDVYPKDNKISGAFEMGNFSGQNPFLMFNFRGKYSDVADIAHEFGHACYDKISDNNNPMYDWGMATFTHEVASITNELLYYNYKINNSKTDEEKIYNLENLLVRYSTDLFNAAMWEEFEIYCHQTVETGGILNPEDLCDKWIELSNVYYGEGLCQDDYGQYRWATIPSLLNNYYQYTYATSLCYATVLAENIMNNVPGAKQQYLEFLKAGGSVPSIEALYIAGIDIYDNSVYEQAASYFVEKVDELVNLAKK